jgi:hypothetical protein
MNNIKPDKQHILTRLWRYQAERSPLIAIVIMAALTVGVLYHFSKASIIRYLVSVVIVVLYLIQIRASDEKKDFEHDNKYYKNRPVQRGLVSLKELHTVNQIAIVTQLVLYVSFLDLHIFLLGVASQCYAFLTRKEFFVRRWLREHFFLYNISHYIQLIILFFVIIQIIQPTGLSHIQLLLFTILNIAVVELVRKTLPAKDDLARDTYSAHLGYKGAAFAVVLTSIIDAAFSYFLISQHPHRVILIVVPVLALIPVVNYCYHYGINPNKPNQKGMENAVLLMFAASMLSVIIGT